MIVLRPAERRIVLLLLLTGAAFFVICAVGSLAAQHHPPSKNFDSVTTVMFYFSVSLMGASLFYFLVALTICHKLTLLLETRPELRNYQQVLFYAALGGLLVTSISSCLLFAVSALSRTGWPGVLAVCYLMLLWFTATAAARSAVGQSMYHGTATIEAALRDGFANFTVSDLGRIHKNERRGQRERRPLTKWSSYSEGDLERYSEEGGEAGADPTRHSLETEGTPSEQQQ